MEICEDCKKRKGKQRLCPYDLDINNKKTKAILCNKCYNDRVGDI